MTRYFAYGSNMDPLQMEKRCRGAVVIGPARLDGHRLTFVWDSPGWGGGVATVVAAPGDHVWGVLWDLTDENLETLDRYEGVAVGAYTREQTEVDCSGNREMVMVYLATDNKYKAPSAHYMSALIRGAKAFAVPDDYIERLRALRT